MSENYPDQDQHEIPSSNERSSLSETGNAGERPALSSSPESTGTSTQHEASGKGSLLESQSGVDLSSRQEPGDQLGTGGEGETMGENYPDQNQHEIPSSREMRTPTETGNAGERPALSPPPDVGRGNHQPMQESPGSQEAPTPQKSPRSQEAPAPQKHEQSPSSEKSGEGETGNQGKRPPDAGKSPGTQEAPASQKSPSSQEAPASQKSSSEEVSRSQLDSEMLKKQERLFKLEKSVPEGKSAIVEYKGNVFKVDRTIPGETRIENVKTGYIDQITRFEKREQFAGVPDGKKTDTFGHNRGTPEKPKLHLGIDVSFSKSGDGSANDPRRGSPVYATIKPTIDIKELNTVQSFDKNRQPVAGLGIPGQGTATLERAVVVTSPWQPKPQSPNEYGDVLGLACQYSYTKNDGSQGRFTLYIEYTHLITEKYLPKDGKGNPISKETWEATGKGIGFGDQMKNGAILSKEQLSGATPPLVGYLGATQYPHVHIQAAYGAGQKGYVWFPRIDPSVMLDNDRSLLVK